jgi:Ca-activated chloride channel homolog
MFRFADPLYLLLLLIIPIVLYLRAFREKNIFEGGFLYSSLELFKGVKAFSSFWKKYLVLLLFLLSFACFVVALSRPQTESGYVNLQSEGIDIVLVLDLSGSMKFVDGIPEELTLVKEKGFSNNIYIDKKGKVKNRLNIAKKILVEFVEKRTQDRIGLVVFSDYPYTESPVTISKNIVMEKISNIRFTHTKGQSTALGDAIVSGINKLAHSKSKSKIIILITDGNSNKGEDPVSMSYIAKKEGIKIYSIGIGGTKKVLRPKTELDYSYENKGWEVYEQIPMKDGERLDEDTLRTIADITNGKYFRGSNEEELRDIYNEIDKLEKTKSDFDNIYVEYEEHFFPFILAGLLLLLLAFVLKNTLFRVLP